MFCLAQIVRTFFRTNRNTCLEWLARIRLCVMTIAAHAGMPAVVIRHAHEMLNDLVDVDNTQVFDGHTFMYELGPFCKYYRIIIT